MTDDVKNLAAAFAKYVPEDAKFYFAAIQRDGSVSTMTSIKDPGAVVEFLERCLEHAEEREKAEGA